MTVLMCGICIALNRSCMLIANLFMVLIGGISLAQQQRHFRNIYPLKNR